MCLDHQAANFELGYLSEKYSPMPKNTRGGMLQKAQKISNLVRMAKRNIARYLKKPEGIGLPY